MKKTKGVKICAVALAAAMSLGGIGTSVGAIDEVRPEIEISELSIARATGRFSMDIPAKTTAKAKSSFSLEAGETITIKASYSPFSASVDFGVITPGGDFYYINVSDGSIDETIEVDERGEYTFAIRNNSSKTVSASGYVKY